MSEIIYTCNEGGFPIPNYHCDCGHVTEGFQICLKCDPQTYKVEGMKDDSLDDTQFTQDVLKIAQQERDRAALQIDLDEQKEACWNNYVAVGVGKHCDYTANVYGREVWNSAIEAAAEITKHSGYVEQIRKLKK